MAQPIKTLELHYSMIHILSEIIPEDFIFEQKGSENK